jgi:hypothetical protein
MTAHGFHVSSTRGERFMPRESHGAAVQTNRGGAETCTASAVNGSTNVTIAQVLRDIFPDKAWAHLGSLLRLEERTAKHRMAATREFSADEIARLLHQPFGFKVVAAIMSQAKPAPLWWRVCRPLMELADIQQMQLNARRRLGRVLKGAVDADAEINAAIARADAALSVRDEEFDRPHLDALRSIARVPDRAVAPQKRGR